MFEEFKIVGKDLFSEGLVSSRGGDMSVRKGDSIFITKRDAPLGRLGDDDIVEVPLEGKGEKDEEASRELIVHRAIYKNTNAQAIINANPARAAALSLGESKIIPQDSEGSFFLRSVPVVRVREAIGSDEAAKMLPPIFASNYVIAVLRGGGSFSAARTLNEAHHFTSCLERSCKVISAAKALEQKHAPQPQERQQRKAIPPSIGVMDRGRRRDFRGGRGGRR